MRLAPFLNFLVTHLKEGKTKTLLQITLILTVVVFVLMIVMMKIFAIKNITMCIEMLSPLASPTHLN